MNDAWWESEERAFTAWEAAIDAAGLTWRYREVHSGEWNVLERAGDAAYRKQGGGGTGRLDRGAHADSRLDLPLPWDHVDTGISKWRVPPNLRGVWRGRAVAWKRPPPPPRPRLSSSLAAG